MSEIEATGSKKIKKHPVRQFIDSVFLPTGVAIISLGSFSEAFILVDDFITMIKTRLSNEFEYQLLEDINVGNTLEYVEEILGSPAVVKELDGSYEVKYYIQEKFLLTAYYNGERVDAYTVISLKGDFSPEIPWLEDQGLGESLLSNLNEQPLEYSFDNARTNRFFIESSTTELKGLFQSAYIGTIQYGKGELDQGSLDNLYDQEVFGSEEETLLQIKNLRSKTYPNFYGEGELDLETINKGLLSNGEFLNFFGK